MVNHDILTEFISRVYNQKPQDADAICVHGWGDMHDAMLKYTAELYQASGAADIVLNGASEYEVGAPGFAFWKDVLVSTYAVPAEAVIQAGAGKQTREEAIAFADIAKQKKYRTIVLSTVPVHLPRAFLTVLQVFQENGIKARIVPRTTSSCDWNEWITIRGLFNDTEQTTRLGRFAGEIARAVNYRNKFEAGDALFGIASIEEGLAYLKHLPS